MVLTIIRALNIVVIFFSRARSSWRRRSGNYFVLPDNFCVWVPRANRVLFACRCSVQRIDVLNVIPQRECMNYCKTIYFCRPSVVLPRRKFWFPYANFQISLTESNLYHQPFGNCLGYFRSIDRRFLRFPYNAEIFLKMEAFFAAFFYILRPTRNGATRQSSMMDLFILCRPNISVFTTAYARFLQKSVCQTGSYQYGPVSDSNRGSVARYTRK